MTKIHQPKVSMRAVHSLPGSGTPAVPADTTLEVVPHARRRHFSNADKRRILAAADRCTKPGEIGALMRRCGCVLVVLEHLETPTQGRRPGRTGAAIARTQD